mgnify:CR=1 FL=1
MDHAADRDRRDQRPRSEEERDYYAEAVRIMDGSTALLPEVGHLLALHAAHEAEMLSLIQSIDQLHTAITGGFHAH